MSVYCQQLQALITRMQTQPEMVERFEHDLQWLAAWNHEDETAMAAASLLAAMAKALRENTPHLDCVLDTVRCALAALWPYVEESPEGELDELPAWYDVTLPYGPVPAPDPEVVPKNLCMLWVRGQTLRTLEGLRELAKLKGLWLLKNDIPYSRRYQVIVPGAKKNSTLLFYAEAARIIEAFPA